MMSMEVRELEHSMARRTVAHLQGENAVLRARVAELEAALKPFVSDHPITNFDFVIYRQAAIAALAQEAR